MIRSVDELFAAWGCDPGGVLLLRCDTEMPGGALGLVQAMPAATSEPELMVLSTADAQSLSHTGLGIEAIEAARMPKDAMNARISDMFRHAPLVVSYSWAARKSFSQAGALEGLSDYATGLEAPRPACVIDLFDMQRAWLSASQLSAGGSPAELASAISVAGRAYKGMPTGTLGAILGEAWGTGYDESELKSADARVWLLSNVWRVMRTRRMFS